jgi:hypothetical protein
VLKSVFKIILIVFPDSKQNNFDAWLFKVIQAMNFNVQRVSGLLTKVQGMLSHFANFVVLSMCT